MSEVRYFFWKEQDGKYLGLHGRLVSEATTQLCCCCMKAATDNTEMNGRRYVSIKLYVQK